MTDSARSSAELPRPHIGLLWRKHGRPVWDEFHWYVLVALFLVAFALGIDGFRQAFDARDEYMSPTDLVYLTFQLFILKSGADTAPDVPWELNVARFLAPAVALSAALGALAVVFREQVQALLVRFWSRHTVVCGLGHKGLLLARSFRDRGERVVAIERDEGNPHIPLCRAEGMTVLVGDATATPVLRRARAHHARYLLAVCGDETSNARAAERARELRRRGVLTAAVHVVTQDLCDLLAEGQFSARGGDHFRLEFFNVFERGAQAWLAEHPPFRDDRRHLVVVGLDDVGKALVVGAARAWLATNPESTHTPRVTLVDPAARHKAELLCLRYPQLGEVCELVPVQVEVESEELERGEFLDPLPSAVYVCLDDDARGLAVGLALFQRVRGRDVPIIVRTARAGVLPDLVGGFEQLHPFGLLERTCTADVLLSGTRNEILARAMHSEYVRKQGEDGQTPETNPSMVEWDALPESLRESNRRQADHIPVKLKAIRCGLAPLTDWRGPLLELTPEEVEQLARVEHDRWRAERVLEGWTYTPGPKDIMRKTTPWLIPWEKMPEQQRDYDRNTVRNLPRFLAQAGLRMYRLAESPPLVTSR